MEISMFTSYAQKVLSNCSRVIVGKESAIEKILVCFICSGHVLLEDRPGTGKTMLLRAFARTVGGDCRRVQCTPDLLPSDLTGINFYNQKTGEFEFRPGPLFSHFVLADELNRATPRTQSALLEAMAERQITVDGQTLWDAADPRTQSEEEIRKKRLHFGLVFQNFNLFPQYTALQNVMLAGQLLAKERPDYKQNKKAIFAGLEARARDLLAQMGLSDRAGHYPHQLSGGQQQRVAIARALALQPDILCFDEPTSALDPELTGEVLRVLRALAEQKTTMIIVTHEMHFARDVADRILFMDGGSVVEEGPAHEVIDHPREERTRRFLASYAAGNA